MHTCLSAAAAFTARRSASAAVRRRAYLEAFTHPNRLVHQLVRPTGLPHFAKAPESRLFSSVSNDKFFSDHSFADIGITSPVLIERLAAIGLTKPSVVQAATYQAVSEGGDVTIGAETGSGKTLAYLLPLLNDILMSKTDGIPTYDYCRAIILVPNKELVQQVLRMALPLCGGNQALVTGGTRALENSVTTETTDPQSIIRLAVMPGGLSAPADFPPFRKTIGMGGKELPVDIIISTPAAVAPLGLKPAHMNMFVDIRTLVIDEADMLLDGGYIRPFEEVLMGFRRADKLDKDYGVARTQYVFSAATLPDMGLRSVEAYITRKFPKATRISMAGMHRARHTGLSEQTLWIQEDSNKERMKELVRLLQLPKDDGGLVGEKCMVFLNSVDDVDGAQGALERAGLMSVPYHAKISVQDRQDNLEAFRSGKIPVMVCTDLASRGLDVPGVTVVVQLQFARNVVAHLHRMGRCGRAGDRNGRGIIFYPSIQAELVAVVREAEDQQEKMVLEGDVDEVQEEEEEKGKEATVKAAFSRRRGFTKKRKKARRDDEIPLE